MTDETTRQAYQTLMDHVRTTAVARSISWLLSWDQETMMPPRGAEHRARQLAFLAGLSYERATSPEVEDLLAKVERTPWLAHAGPIAQANVHHTRRICDRLKRVPKALVEELARTVPIAQGAWAEARRTKSFASFQPHLEKIVRLKRQEAAALSLGATGDALYDALIDEHEPAMTTAECLRHLNALADGLVPLVRAIGEKPNPPLPWAGRRFPIEKQRLFCAALPPLLGLSPNESRLDVSAHPFCQTVGSSDVRITTRFDESDLRGAYFGVMHETGHALYEAGLDPEQYGTPVGEALSIGVHESQSRLWENMVGRSLAWWRNAYGVVRGLFVDALFDVSLDAFYRAVNRVEPSLIRVEADEVTYNLHIVVRVRLERQIIAGDLAVKDIPAAWNAEYTRVLGVTPRDDGVGCLQDVHWSVGAFGYFPTYALGNMYAAALMEAAKAALPSLDDMLSHGETAPLLLWLQKNVHKKGSVARGARIIEEATGQPPDVAAFMRYVTLKYKPLYNL